MKGAADMKDLISFAIIALPSLIVITNPLMVTSMFISLTAQYPAEAKGAVIRKTTFVSLAVLLVFAISGTLIFRFFSITIGAFQIAGGVILFMVALNMLHAIPSRTKQSPEEMSEAMSREDIGVVPLAIPMLSGPGAITTVIVLAGDSKTWSHMIVLIASIILTMLITYIMMKNASRLQRFLGATGLNITTRLLGLILAAIAVQFVIGGIKAVIPEIAAVLH
jgi:multiple antibiotic resistance protein